MNTSGRRAPVIAWAIVAAALSGGVGVAAPAPAVADDSGPGVATGPTDSEGSSNGFGPRRHTRDAPDGSGDTSNGGGDGRPADPCPWWPKPIPYVPAPAGGGNSGGNGGLIAPVPAAVAPVPVFGDGARTPAQADLPDDLDLDIPAVAALPAAAPQPAAGYSGYPAPRSVLVPRAVPGRRFVPPPPAAPIRAAVVRPPAAPPPPPQRPSAAVDAPAPERLGYPAELRDADLARLFSMALPGLAAIAGMTALGGLVGYRQARAGYLLRAAGAGRFLQ